MNDDDVARLRANAIKNMAQQLGIPPELLAGPPTPWGELLTRDADEIAEAARKDHDELMASMHVRLVWPWLRALGVEDPERYRLVYEAGYLHHQARSREVVSVEPSPQTRRWLERMFADHGEGWAAILGTEVPEHHFPEQLAAVDALWERLVQRGVAQKHHATLTRVSLDHGTCESVMIARDTHTPATPSPYVLVNLLTIDSPSTNAAGQQCVSVQSGRWEVMHVRPDRDPDGVHEVITTRMLRADVIPRRETLSGLDESSEVDTVADRVERVLDSIRWL